MPADTLLSYAYLAFAVSFGGGAILAVFYRRLDPAGMFRPLVGKPGLIRPTVFPLPSAGLFLGRTALLFASRRVRLAHEDRRRHLGIIGGRAAEREAFLANLVRQDMHAGYGICLVAAGAGLAERVLSHVPTARASDVIYLDAADTERPLGVGALQWEPDRAADGLAAAIRDAVARDGALRGILGQESPTFRARAALDGRNILLVNLAADRIGEADAALLGRVVLSGLLAAAYSRAADATAAKSTCHVYLDAAAGYAGRSLIRLIGAARRAGITLTIAEPSLTAIAATTRGALMNGLGSNVVLGADPADAPLLSRHLALAVLPSWLASPGTGRVLARLCIGGEAAPPLAIRPASASSGDPAAVDRARTFSRMTYGRPRLAVEAEINRRFRQESSAPMASSHLPAA